MDKFLQEKLDGNDECASRESANNIGHAGQNLSEPVKAHWLGRATRREFFPVVLVCHFIINALARADGAGPAIGVACLLIGTVILVESIRRLHDRGMSGWWVVLFLVPFMWMVMGAIRGQRGPNKYGPDPRKPQRN